MPHKRRTTLPIQFDDWWQRTQARFAIMVPRRVRLMNWLTMAQESLDKRNAEKYPSPFQGGIVVNREGGYGYRKDLRFLVDRKLLKMERRRYAGGWGGPYDLNVTVLVITELGQTALKHGSI